VTGTVRKYGVALLPAVVTLRNSRVYVGGPDSGDVPAKVEGIVYQQLCFGSILRIPNVKLDNNYVGLGKSLDDPGFHCEIHRFK